MHRIRLREPWTSRLNAESGAIIYARKFHKPTGVDDQPITLKIFLIPQEPESPNVFVAVLVNGCELLAMAPSNEASSLGGPVDQALNFQLNHLETFNSLELRISGATALTCPSVPIFGATAIPTFGSFVIESVELQIE